MIPQSFSFSPQHDALFLDVDGTPLDIADVPDAVAVPPALTAGLEALQARLGGALALVSGRTLADLDRTLKTPGLAAAGAHGFMRWPGRLKPYGQACSCVRMRCRQKKSYLSIGKTYRFL